MIRIRVLTALGTKGNSGLDGLDLGAANRISVAHNTTPAHALTMKMIDAAQNRRRSISCTAVVKVVHKTCAYSAVNAMEL